MLSKTLRIGVKHLRRIVIARWLITPVFSVIVPLYVEGTENIPKEGGVLVICNHRSIFDPVIMQYVIRRKLHYMSRRELFEYPGLLGTFFRWLISFYGAFPVKRWWLLRFLRIYGTNFCGVRLAIELLRRGEVVLIFPEGDINSTQEGLLEFQKGAAFIARCSGATVIHSVIVDSDKVWTSRFNPFPSKLFQAIHVRFGQAKAYSFEEQTTQQVMEEMKNDIFQLLQTTT